MSTAFSQITGNSGLCTSTIWMSAIVSAFADCRKPKDAASVDEPSRISAAPACTRLCQSAAAGVEGGITMMFAVAAEPGAWPAEERITGHGPGWGESTENVPPCANPGNSNANNTIVGQVRHF